MRVLVITCLLVATTGAGASTVRVPVRMLEHYRFKLRPPNEQQGVGQGQAKPGDRIGRPQQQDSDQRGQGECVEFLHEVFLQWPGWPLGLRTWRVFASPAGAAARAGSGISAVYSLARVPAGCLYGPGSA